jgi:osmotically inducible protein OsmC
MLVCLVGGQQVRCAPVARWPRLRQIARQTSHATKEITMPTRTANATWEGGLKGGKGSFKGESGAISGGYSFGTRFENAPGTNPEELLGASHAACFSMALAAGLEKAGKPATRVDTKAQVAIEKVGDGFSVTGIRLTTRASAPGVSKEEFQRIAEATKVGCPISKALASVKIELDAQLA